LEGKIGRSRLEELKREGYIVTEECDLKDAQGQTVLASQTDTKFVRKVANMKPKKART
jgi:hypothetical protein